MFKRITTFLTVLFMGLVLTVRSPVKADTFSLPFSAVPDLINAFYTIASGGKIEFSTLIGEFTGYDEFVQNLHEYYDTHYTEPLIQSTQGLIDMGLSVLALNGVDSITQVNGITVPVTPQDLANFMGYNYTWADRYNDVENIEVNPDITYIDYLNKINALQPNGFWWKNLNVGGTAIISNWTFNYNASEHSFVSFGTISGNWDYGSQLIMTPGILSLYIYSSGGTYSFTSGNIQYVSDPVTINNSYRDCFSLSAQDNLKSNINMYPSNQGIMLGNNRTAQVFNLSYTGSLSEVLNFISGRFRNVNIYVDGELWSYVGDIPSPAITLNNPTDVGDTGNITYSVYPFTATGDIGLDLAKWGEYLYEKATSGTDVLTMDTVIDDGWDLVDTEDGERAITEEDEEDVAKVIHGFVENTATTPTPTPDIGDPPVLKIIPPILELPDEIWPDGGRDTTVLAQMVHATDVAIPNDIMTVIWSTIGLLVVGGLISILHK